MAVVGLAKGESPAIEAGVTAAGAPLSVVGVAIALLVLLPETLAAVNAAARDRMQTSFNLAYGSALASIGLTIPAIAVASIWIDGPLLLGLSGTELVLLAVTAVVGSLTVGLGQRYGARRRGAPRDLRGVPVRRGHPVAVSGSASGPGVELRAGVSRSDVNAPPNGPSP